ncbi:ricin-type beta-trefoil lectin domain protein [Streptomyces sp. NPDC035033]|uniref:ricin-type beta-trefoil lectin domain protein n=1 Tax=Streptomyces sp. NPDC035033 TaxID=3155368 RepID=UPI0033CC00C2
MAGTPASGGGEEEGAAADPGAPDGAQDEDEPRPVRHRPVLLAATALGGAAVLVALVTLGARGEPLADGDTEAGADGPGAAQSLSVLPPGVSPSPSTSAPRTWNDPALVPSGKGRGSGTPTAAARLPRPPRGAGGAAGPLPAGPARQDTASGSGHDFRTAPRREGRDSDTTGAKPTAEPTRRATATARPTSTPGPTPRPTSTTAAPAAPAAASPVVHHIVSKLNGRCVDVTDYRAAAGTRLQMWDCAPHSNQRWEFRSDGTLRAMGFCLTSAWQSGADGSPIQLAACTGGARQKWVLNSREDLVNPAADKCLDIIDANAGNGARLQLWSCNGRAHQKWVRR